MADHTTLTHRLVLIDKWAALRGVAFKASLVFAQESKPAGFEALLNISPAAFDRDPLVRVVTIGATHFSFQDRMMMWQLKLRPHFQVTLETSLRRLLRINDRMGCTAGFNVQTARAVARLAAHVLGVLSFRLQPRVRRRSEVAYNLFVAGPAFLCAYELRAWDLWRRKNCLICGAARKQNHGERGCSPDAPKQLFALTVDPSS
jgi:hypothetical protein